jgi:hypothetical protein
MNRPASEIHCAGHKRSAVGVSQMWFGSTHRQQKLNPHQLRWRWLLKRQQGGRLSWQSPPSHISFDGFAVATHWSCPQAPGYSDQRGDNFPESGGGLGDRSNIWRWGELHLPPHISIDYLARTTHQSGPQAPLVNESIGMEWRHPSWQRDYLNPRLNAWVQKVHLPIKKRSPLCLIHTIKDDCPLAGQGHIMSG